MPSDMPAGLLVSVFLLMFLVLEHLAIHSLCQNYFEATAILSMSSQDPLMVREFVTILSLLCRARAVGEGRKRSWVDVRPGS